MRMRLLVATSLVASAAAAAGPVTIHPFELITRNDLVGQAISTACYLVDVRDDAGVCLAPDQFGVASSLSPSVGFAELADLNAEEKLERARQDCAGAEPTPGCRIDLQGTAGVRDGMPSIEVSFFQFRN